MASSEHLRPAFRRGEASVAGGGWARRRQRVLGREFHAGLARHGHQQERVKCLDTILPWDPFNWARSTSTTYNLEQELRFWLLNNRESNDFATDWTALPKYLDSLLLEAKIKRYSEAMLTWHDKWREAAGTLRRSWRTAPRAPGSVTTPLLSRG